MATKLEKLYSIIQNSKEVGVKLSDDVIRQINEAEENIIREEILPIIAQDMEPNLGVIKRDLVLVVEYHPGTPIRVALSRKMKINQITDAKTITPSYESVGAPVKPATPREPEPPHEPTKHVENPSKGLRVQFPDGSIVCKNTAIETFKTVLRRIGLERIHMLNIMHSGYNLVSRTKRIDGKISWQHELDGWYIYSILCNEVKIKDLKRISRELHLNLKIDEAKPSN